MAEVQAQLFGDLADTFAAVNRDPRALQETRSRRRRPRWRRRPRRSACRPRSWPGSRTCRAASGRGPPSSAALPLINGALSAGIPAFRRTPDLGERLDLLLDALATLSENPNTLLSLRDLRRALQVSRPAIQQVAPYQTVCNYLVYFFNPLGTHLSETVPGGTQERIKAKLANLTQANTLGLTEFLRPVDVPTDQNLQSATSKRCTPSMAAWRSTSMATPTARAGRPVTRTGRDRLALAARLVGWRVHRRRLAHGLDGNTPGLAGGTYKSRQLGIDNLKDVP